MAPSSPSASLSSDEGFWDGLFSSCGSLSTEEDNSLLDLHFWRDELEEENPKEVKCFAVPLEVRQLHLDISPLLPRPFLGFSRKPNCLDPSCTAAGPVVKGQEVEERCPSNIPHDKSNNRDQHEDIENSSSSVTEIEPSFKDNSKPKSTEQQQGNCSYNNDAASELGGSNSILMKTSESRSLVNIGQNMIFPASLGVTTIEGPHPLEKALPPSGPKQQHSIDFKDSAAIVMIPLQPIFSYPRAEIIRKEALVVQVNAQFATQHNEINESMDVAGGHWEQEESGSNALTGLSDHSCNCRNPLEAIVGYSTVPTTPLNSVDHTRRQWPKMKSGCVLGGSFLWQQVGTNREVKLDRAAVRPPSLVHHSPEAAKTESGSCQHSKLGTSATMKCVTTPNTTNSNSPSVVLVPRSNGNDHKTSSSIQCPSTQY